MNIRKILIGIDDSKFAEHAAEYGFDIAHKFNAAVGLVNIVEPIAIPQQYNTTLDPTMNIINPDAGPEELELLDIQKAQSAHIVERFTKQFGENMQIAHFTDYGSTADGILKCSKEFEADLIVIGTHHRSGLDRLLMGSVAEHVVRHSDVPVLVVPFGEDVHS